MKLVSAYSLYGQHGYDTRDNRYTRELKNIVVDIDKYDVIPVGDVSRAIDPWLDWSIPPMLLRKGSRSTVDTYSALCLKDKK